MLTQAILLALVAMLGNAEYLLGTSLLSRPIIMGTFTGIVMGDITTGIQIGAAMELAFMGAFFIGASIPPEMISGTILGTAFAISMGAGAETALAIGIPVASLVLIAKNFGMVFILPTFVHKADKCAENGDMRGVAMCHFLGGFFGVNLIVGLCVGIGFYIGGPAVESFLGIIPDWVTKGLEITMGILPSIGFGLLMKMIMNKSNALFFVLGFCLSAYFKLPGTGIAIFGAIIAIILTQIKKAQTVTATVGGGEYEDDDF